jgi:hypothetical protein
MKTGLLFEEEGLGDAEAIRAYSEATDSADAPEAAAAAMRAARLLRKHGAFEDAHAEILQVAARPDVAWYLGALLEEDARPEEAVEVYRAAIAREADPLRAATLKLRLVILLLEDKGSTPEALALLEQLHAEGVEEVSWRAAVLLAHSVADEDPARADALYREILEEQDPLAVATATSELAKMLESAGEGEAAEALLREQAEASQAVAAQLAELS